MSDGGNLQLAPACVLSETDEMGVFKQGVGSQDKILFWPLSGKSGDSIHWGKKNVSTLPFFFLSFSSSKLTSVRLFFFLSSLKTLELN